MDGKVPVTPMLAAFSRVPFHRPGWVYEEKYDGYRIMAYKDAGRVRLISRRGREWTTEFQDVAEAVARVSARTVILDGEVVVFDKRLVSRFELLRDRADPLIYPVFDCLHLDGRDLRREPLRERRRLLEDLVAGVDRLIPARRLAEDGLAAYRQVLRLGYEGMVAKDEAAPYTAGRSKRWIKVKPRQEARLVIGGFRGEAMRFEELLLGAYKRGALQYVGRVEWGVSPAVRDALTRAFPLLAAEQSPFINLPRSRRTCWLTPRLIARIGYQEVMNDGMLRHPSLLGLDTDLRPEECRLPLPSRLSRHTRPR